MIFIYIYGGVYRITRMWRFDTTSIYYMYLPESFFPIATLRIATIDRELYFRVFFL